MEVTDHQDEKKVLELLCSQQGSEYYKKLFVEHRMNIVDLLKLLPSCRPSLGLLYGNYFMCGFLNIYNKLMYLQNICRGFNHDRTQFASKLLFSNQ